MLNRILSQSTLGLAALLATAGAAQAQFTISEICFNPTGTDQGGEFVEIRGPASSSLAGYFLLVIEGDNTSAGVVDIAQDLSTYSTGTNGLLMIRDSNAVFTDLSPLPDPATSIVFFDWTPDIENGNNTYVLGFGTPPAAASDLDAGNDGTLDAPLTGFTVTDAVGLNDITATTPSLYADDLGGFNTPAWNVICPTCLSFTPNAIYRLYNSNGTPCNWAGGFAGGNVPGPYTWDPTRVFGGLTGGTMDPGSLNITLDADSDGISDACDTSLPGFTAFCAGDGTLTDHTTPCPCGNDATTLGNGCAHSFDAGGCKLDASGTPALDDVILHSSFSPATSFTLFMQHDALGDGVFHDGVLCAGGTLIRIRGRNAGGALQPGPGEAIFPNSNFANDSMTLSVRGLVTVGSGARRYYAAWYRNASTTFCPPATANVSNGWIIDW